MKEFARWVLEGWNSSEQALWDTIVAREDTPAQRLNLYHRVEKLLLRQQRSLPTLFKFIDARGYTPSVLRTLLEFHWTTISTAPVGSDSNSVYIDVCTATGVLAALDKEIVEFLRDGYSVKFIGTVFGKNGSRLVSRACRELSKVLEGAK